MHLATPAPKVCLATAERALSVEAAFCSAAQPSEAPRAETATTVEPAVTMEDPMQFAPMNVRFVTTAPDAILSVAELSGSSGSDFESHAAVLRGSPKKNLLQVWLPFIFDERDFVSFGEVLRFVLIKGNCCFVFADKESQAPIYAIPLEEVTARLEDPNHPDALSFTISPTPQKRYQCQTKKAFVTVLLKYRNDGSHAYQFTFDTSNDPSTAKRFCDMIEKSVKTKNRTVTASVQKAKDMGMVAAKSQPII